MSISVCHFKITRRYRGLKLRLNFNIDFNVCLVQYQLPQVNDSCDEPFFLFHLRFSCSLFFFKYLSYICQTVNFLLSLPFFSKLRSRLIKPTVWPNRKKLKKKKRYPLYNYQSGFNPSVISFYNHFLLSDQISDVCKKNYMRDLYRKIDGAVLMSQLEKDLDCTITFQTHSILQRFMLRFDQLQLDCNDHLYIYDGAHAVSSYKVSPSVPFQSGIL